MRTLVSCVSASLSLLSMQWIGYAIASVIAQTHRDWTVVVLDGSSSDGAGEVVALFC